MACFTDNYPVPVNPDLDKLVFERRRARGGSVLGGDAHMPGLFD